MSGRDTRVRGSGGSGDRERNGPDDKGLQDALAACARGAVQTVIGIASARNVLWADALSEFGKAFDVAGADLIARLAERRGQR